MSRRPSRRCPRASGIGHRSRRQADSGGSWPQCIVETWRGCLRNSAKSPPPLRTCRRAFSATADSGKEKRYAMTCPWQHKHNPFHRKVRFHALPETLNDMMLLPNVPDFCTPQRSLTKIYHIIVACCAFAKKEQNQRSKGGTRAPEATRWHVNAPCGLFQHHDFFPC